MDIMETVARIKSQLQEIELQEAANQQEQARVSQRIAELETELKQNHNRRNELDREALKLYTKAEELRPKLSKLERIANLSREFLELHDECQDNQDLLNTLYSSVSHLPQIDPQKTGTDIQNDRSESSSQTNSASSDRRNDNDYSISIESIKQAMPNAEKVYQQLVAAYLEEYKTYQNYIIDGLDLIWYAVAFIAFGRDSYRKMSFKYHPDLDGSQMAMQLINTAWSISQNFLTSSDEDDTML